MVDHGGVSLITDGSGNLNAGYARILTNSGSTPSGVAIFGERIGGTLVTEAGVPAAAPIQNGRIYAEVGPSGFTGLGTDIGLAVANPGAQAAAISFSLTNAAGIDVGSGTYNLAAGTQSASFLDQDPWNAPLGFQGTFSFSSNVPVSVVALEGYRNQRNEFLITTLPVIDTSAAVKTTPVILPHFTDGTGWSTYVLLVNPTDTPMSGTIQFRAQGGTVQSLTANGQTANSFAYSIPRRSSFKLTTAGAGVFKSGTVHSDAGFGKQHACILSRLLLRDEWNHHFAGGRPFEFSDGIPDVCGRNSRTDDGDSGVLLVGFCYRQFLFGCRDCDL